MEKRYVVTFLFDEGFNIVWMIEKQKPEWQKGSLNGIGGKIEKGEIPIDAAVRELKEEAGVDVDHAQLCRVGKMVGVNNDDTAFSVEIFTGITNEKLVTMEEEQIVSVPLFRLGERKYIENVPVLIEACKYRLRGTSHFSELIMTY